MKSCLYCATAYPSNGTQCPRCGSKQSNTQCDSCRTVYNANFYACPTCGWQQENSKTYCPGCGNTAEGRYCSVCGADTQNFGTRNNPYTANTPPPSGYGYGGNYANAAPGETVCDKWVAFLLCFFLGGFGAHKFYEGKIGMGILYLFTGGLFGIGWLVDWIMILGKPEKYVPNPSW